MVSGGRAEWGEGRVGGGQGGGTGGGVICWIARKNIFYFFENSWIDLLFQSYKKVLELNNYVNFAIWAEWEAHKEEIVLQRHSYF